MPRRTREQLYADRLEEMSNNTLLVHLGGKDDIIARPISEIADENGEPTFAFMKKVHDEYHELAIRHRTLRVRREWIMGYEMFAKAVLKRRTMIRTSYAAMFEREDIGPEHPFTTQLYKAYVSGEYINLQETARSITENGEA